MILQPPIKLTDCNCPRCKSPIDAVSSVEKGVTPQPGHLSVCAFCGEMLIFNDDLSVRSMAPEEFAQMEAEAPEVAEKMIFLTNLMRNPANPIRKA
jgi:hypothetical protein